jgi:hypothetical protein
LKTASWCLTLGLAFLLIRAFLQVPPPGPDSPLNLHLWYRYQKTSQAETGIGSPVGAVTADYRGLELVVLSGLLSTALFGLLTLFNGKPGFFRIFPPLLLSLLGGILTWGLGFFCLRSGNNFLDYEALAFWVNHARARLDGALLLTGGALLSLAGLCLLLLRWFGTPEASSGR